MSLFNNKYISFSLYRDNDLEAFYEIDPKYRWSIIYAHMMIHFLPVLVITLFFWGMFDQPYMNEVITFTLIFYVAVILETMAYLFPKTRKVVKENIIWVFLSLAVFAGFLGYYLSSAILNAEMSTSQFIQLMYGTAGGFGIFVWTYIGMSLVLKASRAIYTKKADIQADVRFATEVQRRILEDVTVKHKTSKAYGTSIPANELGGDFFELSRSDNCLFACIGDVSGHSFGAGLLMTMTRSALQTHLVYNQNPSEVAKALNDLFVKQSDRSMYATMSLLKLDLEKLEGELCNAGHLPLLHYQSEVGELVHQYRQGLGLGLTSGVEYQNQQFSVTKGDLLILYSDGLVETRDESDQVREASFFESIVKEAIGQISNDPQKLSQEIFNRVQQSDSAPAFEDDATLIIVQV